MVERFIPREDPRPDAQPWGQAAWPPEDNKVLRGTYVELNISTAADGAGLFRALDHESVWTHIPGRPFDVEAMTTQIEWKQTQPTWCPWTVRTLHAIGDFAAGEIVGTSSYLDTSAPDARTEIGSTAYAPSVWASKVNPETKLLLFTYAFEDLGMGRVQLKTDIRNARSQQAIARLGATYEGVLYRHQRRGDGTVRDSVMFSVIAEQWPEVRRGLEERLTGE